jgi:flagellar FliL protein
MAGQATADDIPAPKRSKKPLVIGLVLAILLGAGGFYATWSGLILGDHAKADDGAAPGPLTGIAFVPLETMIISLGDAAGSRHLRFTAQVEVAEASEADVTLLAPRIMDVLNSYLRAIEISAIEDPKAMAKLRAQMLRRIQIVTGEGRVRDLLITEFVLN